ncbi:hypothetical protein FQZ97_1091590 [compost metagenome]
MTAIARADADYQSLATGHGQQGDTGFVIEAPEFGLQLGWGLATGIGRNNAGQDSVIRAA